VIDQWDYSPYIALPTSPMPKTKSKPEDSPKVEEPVSETTEEKPNAVVESDSEAESEKSQKTPAVSNPETLFVGNVPVDCRRKELKQLLSSFGTIASVRFRSIPIANPKIPPKAALLGKKLQPLRDSMHAYVVFTNASAVSAALEHNRKHPLLLRGKHVRLDATANGNPKGSDATLASRSLFVGNLPLECEEEAIRQHFAAAGGDIDYVRILRDAKTQLSKGVAYVVYRQASDCTLGLTRNQSLFGKRELRVARSSIRRMQTEKGKESSGAKTVGSLPKGAQRRLAERRSVKRDYEGLRSNEVVKAAEKWKEQKRSEKKEKRRIRRAGLNGEKKMKMSSQKGKNKDEDKDQGGKKHSVSHRDKDGGQGKHKRPRTQ
jgi:RNA recognition motif-containing protein